MNKYCQYWFNGHHVFEIRTWTRPLSAPRGHHDFQIRCCHSQGGESRGATCPNPFPIEQLGNDISFQSIDIRPLATAPNLKAKLESLERLAALCFLGGSLWATWTSGLLWEDSCGVLKWHQDCLLSQFQQGNRVWSDIYVFIHIYHSNSYLSI